MVHPAGILPNTFAERARLTLHRFLEVEATSGVVLLIAATAALIWANSRFADSYHAFWHLQLSIELGDAAISKTLHFLINDGLMTIFFLVVGLEIRREIHEGALSKLDQAALPIVAAAGGVIIPALIYLVFNTEPVQAKGWAVPTATDIAFAVGMLALLGKSVPVNLRIFLLALAVIDDVIAVLIIAIFYSEGLQFGGFGIVALGILIALGFQRMGIGSALPYVVPGAVVWGGFLLAGAHPTLAGVVLGLITPVRSTLLQERPLDVLWRIAQELRSADALSLKDSHKLGTPLRQIGMARREMLPPVVRVQLMLHPWVAFCIMPTFALANAGVTLTGIENSESAHSVLLGVALALVVGKPIGVVGATWIVTRLGWCRFPAGITWGGICLVGLLAGIGFTMSIFIAMLGFADANLLNAAKLGVLLGSLAAAVLGLLWGAVYVRQNRGINR